MDRVSLIYKGHDSINFKCPGVFKANVKPGDIIENVPHETFEAELKNDPRFVLVSEKPSIKNKVVNKTERITESEGK